MMGGGGWRGEGVDGGGRGREEGEGYDTYITCNLSMKITLTCTKHLLLIFVVSSKEPP